MSNVEVGTLNCACYEDGKQFLGVAKIKLPDLEFETFLVKGLGLMGSTELPALGQLKPMKMTIDFTDANEAQYRLAELRAHLLDLRVIKEGYESTTSELTQTDHQYIIQCQPIKAPGGNIEPVSSQEASNEFSVTSLKEYRNGKRCRYIDVIKMIYEDGSGIDRMANIRRQLGMT